MKWILICLCLILSGCGKTGIKKEDVLPHAVEANEIDSSWEVVEMSNNDLIVMLFYDENYSNHLLTIYPHKQKDTFTQAVSGRVIQNNEDVFLYVWEDYYIYMSFNMKQISNYELYNNCDVTKGIINENQPFVLILESGFEEIIFYTSEGSSVGVK